MFNELKPFLINFFKKQNYPKLSLVQKTQFILSYTEF